MYFHKNVQFHLNYILKIGKKFLNNKFNHNRKTEKPNTL